MTALANSFLSTTNPRIQLLSGTSFRPVDQCLVNIVPCQGKTKLLKRPLTVEAGYSRDGGRPGSTGILIGGFVLGGIVVGTLGCVYAPQISKAIAGADRKDLMRKLPKFIYDEEKALEKTRKILTEKIAQLNSAIDNVSAQLHTEDDAPNGVAVNSNEVEAAI